MVNIGDRITIRYSQKLAADGHSLLVNRTGVVTSVRTSRGSLIGVYADIKVMRRLRNYYIPAASVEGPGEIDKLRVLSILKSTVL